jgi:hypothetical protein
MNGRNHEPFVFGPSALTKLKRVMAKTKRKYSEALVNVHQVKTDIEIIEKTLREDYSLSFQSKKYLNNIKNKWKKCNEELLGKNKFAELQNEMKPLYTFLILETKINDLARKKLLKNLNNENLSKMLSNANVSQDLNQTKFVNEIMQIKIKLEQENSDNSSSSLTKKQKMDHASLSIDLFGKSLIPISFPHSSSETTKSSISGNGTGTTDDVENGEDFDMSCKFYPLALELIEDFHNTQSKPSDLWLDNYNKFQNYAYQIANKLKLFQRERYKCKIDEPTNCKKCLMPLISTSPIHMSCVSCGIVEKVSNTSSVPIDFKTQNHPIQSNIRSHYFGKFNKKPVPPEIEAICHPQIIHAYRLRCSHTEKKITTAFIKNLLEMSGLGEHSKYAPQFVSWFTGQEMLSISEDKELTLIDIYVEILNEVNKYNKNSCNLSKIILHQICKFLAIQQPEFQTYLKCFPIPLTSGCLVNYTRILQPIFAENGVPWI